MHNTSQINGIAIRILETFCILHNLLLLGVHEPGEPCDIQDYGPHRLYTVGAHVPTEDQDTLDGDALAESLADYINVQNLLDRDIKFHPYGVQVYDCPCGCGTFVYVSIYN